QNFILSEDSPRCYLRKIGGRGGLVVRSRFRVQARNPIPRKIRHALGLLPAKLCAGPPKPSTGVALTLGERVPAQVSSSSSDRGSKLRCPSRNGPRVASKRDVNVTNLNSQKPVSFLASKYGYEM
ncbi:hypothetical protein AVEN_239323-1, partial [Araneus ventricosus]